MNFSFEWNEDKAKQNIRKHGVSFELASSVFEDELAIVIEDYLHSNEEDRYIIIGKSAEQKVLVVVYTERGDKIRIISARVATKRERKTYEES
jgi:uncharacterized protein